MHRVYCPGSSTQNNIALFQNTDREWSVTSIDQECFRLDEYLCFAKSLIRKGDYYVRLMESNRKKII